jgi:hypothetical protein
VSTTRILVPGEYLDGYRAADHPKDVPDALHALLMAAEATGEGIRRHVVLDVPTDLLPALDTIAYGHFMSWGDEQDRRRHSMSRDERAVLAHRARAAFVVHNQAKRPGVRIRPVERPDTDQERPT